ncbi:MAG: hypothetical protein O7C66_04080, partial [Alphaproteobacteria bacterium]|nr:hypothetical protein [Alphaproteobacteria bacterium]
MGRALDLTISGTRALYGLWIDTPPVLDTGTYFPGAGLLERNWRDIREEAHQFLKVIDRVPR